MVTKFKGRLNVEVRKQEQINKVEDRDFRREELLEKYMAKLLYRQNDRKFEIKYCYIKNVCGKIMKDIGKMW